MKVMILGGGISGLLAAKAIRDVDPKTEISIVDKREWGKPQMSGLHYLHDNCEEDIESSIINNLVMSPDGIEPPVAYCRKIFGEINETAKTNSLVTLPAYNNIYDIRGMASQLLQEFRDSWYVMDVVENFQSINDLVRGWDLVISTIPFPILNQLDGVGYDLEFEKEKVYATLGLPEELKSITNSGIIKNFTVYNTFEEVGWYRASSVFGQEFTEWVEPVEGGFTINKIITAGLDPVGVYKDTGVLPAGRYGEWDRSRLAHEVYYNVKEFMKGEIV